MAAAGTCNGDSGGPIYIQEAPGKYIVTGNEFIHHLWDTFAVYKWYNMRSNDSSLNYFMINTVDSPLPPLLAGAVKGSIQLGD